MNLIRYVILLSTGTLCSCVFFYLILLVCLIAGVIYLVSYVILLCMGTL